MTTATLSSRQTSPLFHWFSVVSVSAYLVFVFVYLRLTKRVMPPASLTNLIKASLRAPQQGALSSFTQEQGFCFVSTVASPMISDMEGYSKVVVYEDGRPLPGAHSSHSDIRVQGLGRFSHWGNSLYISTSDNSDPSTNGRTYTFAEIKVAGNNG